MKCYGITINGKLDPNSLETSKWYLYERYRQTRDDQYLYSDVIDVEMVELEVSIKRTIPKQEIEEHIEKVYGSK